MGRDTELEILYERLDEVERSISQGYQPRTPLPFDTQKRPQCLFLMGVSGIGKTRLAEELARQAICRAFVISRKARLAPYMAMILRALGDLRLAQTLAIPSDTRQRTRLLRRAVSSLTRVLALAGIEHKTRGEARLLLAEV